MKSASMTQPARWKLAAIAACIVLLAVGCGLSSNTTSAGATAPGGTPVGAPSSPAPASPAVSPGNSVLCADAADLRASLDKLTHITVGKSTASEIKADLANVQSNLTAFAASVRSQWQAQISALKSALAKLRTAVSNLTAHPSTSTVAGVATALGDVNAAAQDLLAAVNTRCPAASPSPS